MDGGTLIAHLPRPSTFEFFGGIVGNGKVKSKYEAPAATIFWLGTLTGVLLLRLKIVPNSYTFPQPIYRRLNLVLEQLHALAELQYVCALHICSLLVIVKLNSCICSY